MTPAPPDEEADIEQYMFVFHVTCNCTGFRVLWSNTCAVAPFVNPVLKKKRTHH